MVADGPEMLQNCGLMIDHLHKGVCLATYKNPAKNRRSVIDQKLEVKLEIVLMTKVMNSVGTITLRRP